MCQGVTTGRFGGGGGSTVARKLCICHCVYCLANSKTPKIVQIHVQLVPGSSTDGFASTEECHYQHFQCKRTYTERDRYH